MKKILLMAATCLMLSATAQVTQKNTPFKINYLTKATATSQIFTSALYETTPGNFGTSANTLTLTGMFTAKSTGTTSATYALKAVNSETTALFGVRSDGALFTGTTQAVSSGSFIAGSNTLTVKNGLITVIQ